MKDDHVRFVRPAVLPAPGGLYSPASRVASKELLFLSGQTGRDAAGLVPDGIVAQTRQAFSNIATILTSVGLAFGDVVKFTTYLVRSEDIGQFHEVRSSLYEEFYASGDYPPNTLLVVSQLAREELLIEVETVAAFPG